MIETNCWMPEELYHDWLIDRGFAPEVESFDYCYFSYYLLDGYGDSDSNHGNGVDQLKDHFSEMWESGEGMGVEDDFSGDGYVYDRGDSFLFNLMNSPGD